MTQSTGSQTVTNYMWNGDNKPVLAICGVSQTGNDGSGSMVWYDRTGRQIREAIKGFNGNMILTDNEYNAKGQLYRVSDPCFAGGSPVWAETYIYDSYGRITNISRSSGHNTSYSYSGATVNETTAGKTYSKTSSSDGTLALATDIGGTINYLYYPDGKVKNITAPGGVVTSMLYTDAARNQTQLADPSAGTINYTYNSRGQIKTLTNARGQTTTCNYLDDGRISSLISPEGTTTYTYNDNKQLTGITSPGSISRTYTYDSRGRVVSIGDVITGSGFSTNFVYDSYGRLSACTHPSGIVETMNYNSHGYLSSISAGGVVRYTITGMNARQQITSATYGSGLTAAYGFDTYGYPTSAATGQLQDYRYSFDPVNGNLTSRQNYLRSLSESFTYDNLERLTGITGPQNMSMTYSGNGNISTKSDIGTTEFSYGEDAGPYALSSISSSTGVIPAVTQTASYTSFEKLSELTQGVYSASLLYDSDRQRAKMTIAQNGNTILTGWYAGSSYMKETEGSITKEFTYIGGDAYSAPVVAVTQSGSTAYYYLLRDHLGSITHVVNSANTLEAEYSFDAWGRRRSADDWSYTLNANDKALFAGRGFTGHEHMPRFDMINMNGRLYDPLTARFLSPDNYVQAPDFSQGFNRYTYCLNNPLVYADSDGEITWIPYAIYAVWLYFKNAHDNRDEETGAWAWNPIDWFKRGNNTSFVFGVSTSSDFSDFTGYAGFGSNNIVSSVSYNTKYGVGIGNTSSSGFSDFYYSNFSDEASVVNAIRNINSIGGIWNGVYFVGNEDKARQMLLVDSRFFKVETSYWSTSRGFYFEPIQGNSYGYSYDALTKKTLKYNIDVGYHANTIRGTYRYTKVENIEGSLYIFPDNMFLKSRVYYAAHTHPMNSTYRNPLDLQFSYFLGVRCKVFGWNGLIYEFGGPGYWH